MQVKICQLWDVLTRFNLEKHHQRHCHLSGCFYVTRSTSAPLLRLCRHFSEVGHIVSPRLICLPPSQPASLRSKGTPGFMASDRKSIERTVCNPTITLLPNEETVIQSFSLYLSKTDFKLYNRECVSLSRSQPVRDLNAVHSEAAVYVFIIALLSFAVFVSHWCIPPSPCLWMLE